MFPVITLNKLMHLQEKACSCSFSSILLLQRALQTARVEGLKLLPTGSCDVKGSSEESLTHTPDNLGKDVKDMSTVLGSSCLFYSLVKCLQGTLGSPSGLLQPSGGCHEYISHQTWWSVLTHSLCVFGLFNQLSGPKKLLHLQHLMSICSECSVW